MLIMKDLVYDYYDELSSQFRIEHILQSIDRIGTYLGGKDHQSFSEYFLTHDAWVSSN
jgi:uncharacterized protein with HEPN domain